LLAVAVRTQGVVAHEVRVMILRSPDREDDLPALVKDLSLATRLLSA
jgi:hypothetical protein